jgi:hypothetical protein
MLYMVECGFSDPMREAEWSAWYSGPKLAKVLKVPGFLCSQRFESIVPAPAPYLAIHAVSSGEVFGTSYRGLGGGSFNEWQPYISNWRRTLFAGLEVAPEITPDDFLLVIDGRPANFDNLGIPLSWLESAGLDGSVPWRAIAPISGVQAGQLRNHIGSSLRIFRPLTRQLQRAA